MNDKSYDHLKILTKQQIIDFLKQNYTGVPSLKEVKFFLWKIKIDIHEKRYDAHCAETEPTEAAKKMDALSVKINAEKDPYKALGLMEEREKHSVVFLKWLKDGQLLDREYKRIERLIK